MLALIGVGLCFVLFGFFAVAVGSEAFHRYVHWDRVAGFSMTLGAAVTSGWILVAALVRRSRFRWGGDAFLAVSALTLSVIPAVVIGVVTTLVTHVADESTLVDVQIDRYGNTISVPAWATVPLGLLAIAFLLFIARVFIVDSRTPGRAGRRRPRRAATPSSGPPA